MSANKNKGKYPTYAAKSWVKWFASVLSMKTWLTLKMFLKKNHSKDNNVRYSSKGRNPMVDYTIKPIHKIKRRLKLGTRRRSDNNFLPKWDADDECY